MKTKINGKDVLNNSWYFPHEIDGELNSQPSETIPNMSYGIREIIEKHVRGIDLPLMRNGVYSEDDIDAPDLNKIIDITEAEELLTQAEAKIASKKSSQNRVQNEPDLGTEKTDQS